ncbi:MAG: parvulin-like peptidyl-prolyl isomerase [Parcubacteria group bacterium Athens1014_10]|nr:MAG: parvulin-like peptidyl-prolyl isomerase [Parcubacteria group bacterium Athens1014_10]TSD06088.1 MAG: parvulin-like peptidyl-prolyl isomerase [Parcubacteria group bacterium Athens0714_12]
MNENFKTTQPTTTESPLTRENYLKEIKRQRLFGIKIAAIVVLVVLIGFFAFYYKRLFIAAMVNGTPISRFAVIKELESVSGKNALDALITQKLINDEVLKKGITVSNDEIDAEIKNVENQVEAQGMTLSQALAAQGLTQENFKKKIVIQKKLEKLLADQVQVTDDEVAKYIKDNKVEIPKGQEDSYKAQIKDQIEQQKMSEAANLLINSLRSQAKINYFTNY